MKKVVGRAIQKFGRFVYWHRHVITDREINLAIAGHIPIEIDIAYDYKKNYPFVGHPVEFYTRVKKEPLPQNISFDAFCRILEKEKNLYAIIDCKDAQIFPFLEKLVSKVGNERLMFSAMVREWGLPRPPNTKVEAHWVHEDIGLDIIKKFQRTTNCYFIAIIRGYSPAWLKKHHMVDAALQPAKTVFKALAIYLPYRYLPFPPVGENRKIYEAGFCPVFGSDLLCRKIPFPYIGVSAFSRIATRIE